MRVRDIIGLVLALILAVGVAFLTRVFLTKDEKPVKEVTVKSEKLTKILVAGRNLSPGDRIKPGDLVWQDWPTKAVTQTDLTEETTKVEEFTDSIVRFPIHKGNPIVRQELVVRGERGLLAAVVSPGKRAISIDVTPPASDSGLIFPGDYVDVVLSKTVPEKAKQVGRSKTILKNIKVLAFDVVVTAPETTPKTPPRVATLEVTPVQAEILMAGAKEGTLNLSLHSLEKGPRGSETEEIANPRQTAAQPTEKKIILMRGKDKSEIQFQEK